MKIYVVTHEEGERLGVFSTLAKARAWALGLPEKNYTLWISELMLDSPDHDGATIRPDEGAA